MATHRLVRIDTRLADLTDGTRRNLNEEIARVLPLLDGGDRKAIADGLDRIDDRWPGDELDQQLDTVRTDMIDLLQADSAATVRKQQTVMVIAIVLTALAAGAGARPLGHRQRLGRRAPGTPPLGRRARGRSRSAR